MPRVSGLFLYPVKSLRGFAVSTAELDALGFVGDRRFLVVDAPGKFLTQRTAPRMARIDARLSPGTLTLSADGAGSVSVPSASDPGLPAVGLAKAGAPLRTVSVWKSEGLQAEDCGPGASAWLSDFLGLPCHLVRIGAKFSRPVLKQAARTGDVFTFADAVPFLVISEASLAQLNDRIQENHGEPIPMNRFRPNIVVADCDAFAEDAWARIRIGSSVHGDAATSPRSSRAVVGAAPESGVLFRSAGKSVRCIITTTDQLTGERGKEPLKTLATFRRNPADPTEVYFGVNLIHETKQGVIRVGDTVTSL